MRVQADRVRVDNKGLITFIALNRPEVKNAVDRETAEKLAHAFRTFDDDPISRVAVFSGSEGSFCSGADLKAAAAGRPNLLEESGDGPMGPTRMKLKKPVIAALSGYAVAGGLELALWCDLRVAEEDTIMGVYCRRWGVPLIDGGTVRLPRLIGLSRALDLILTGRSVTATEALSMGLVNRVVAKGTALVEAEKLANEISQFPQECLRADRKSCYEQFDFSFDEAMSQEFRRGLKVWEIEGRRGAQDFVQKKV